MNGGSHGWRLDYSFGGKRKTLSLGTYPDTGLALARSKADECRQLIEQGVNPSEQPGILKLLDVLVLRKKIERESVLSMVQLRDACVASKPPAGNG